MPEVLHFGVLSTAVLILDEVWFGVERLGHLVLLLCIWYLWMPGCARAIYYKDILSSLGLLFCLSKLDESKVAHTFSPRVWEMGRRISVSWGPAT